MGKVNPDGYWTNHNADPISTVCYVNTTVRSYDDAVQEFLHTGKLPPEAALLLKNLSMSTLVLAAIPLILGIIDLLTKTPSTKSGKGNKKKDQDEKQNGEKKQNEERKQ